MEEKKETKKKTVKKETPKKKKTAPKKTTEVKKEVKKEVKEEVKTTKVESAEEKRIPSVPVEEPFGVRFKRFISSYQFLYTAFGILLALVLILTIMVFTRSREEKQANSNIVFSIMEENTRNSLNMDLETLVGNEYALKVTNYRGNKVNSEEMLYSIKVTNDTNVEIEILKDKEGENLMTNQKETVIQGDPLAADEKEEVIYYFRVVNSDNLKSGDSIQIEVAS